MREYELMLLFQTEEESFKKGLEKAKAVLADNGAEISKEEDREEKTLAYPVKKQERGHYYLIELKLEPAKVLEIDKTFKLHEDILKFMFVKKD
jgi:small subunit ribosomal protein S6